MTPTPLDPMPDVELQGQPLDLSRPELRAVRNRYSSATPLAKMAVLESPAALVVSSGPGDGSLVSEALESEGWFVKSCAGPGKGNCPVMRGERCSLRESVDAAVVFVDPQGPAGELGTLPRLRCAADSTSPGVVAVQGSPEPIRYLGQTACVGSLRGPDAVLEAISALLRGDETS